MKSGHFGVHLFASVWCARVDKYLKFVVACPKIYAYLLISQPNFRVGVICIMWIHNEVEYLGLALRKRAIVVPILKAVVKVFSMGYHAYNMEVSTSFIGRLIVCAIVLVTLFW